MSLIRLFFSTLQYYVNNVEVHTYNFSFSLSEVEFISLLWLLHLHTCDDFHHFLQVFFFYFFFFLRPLLFRNNSVFFPQRMQDAELQSVFAVFSLLGVHLTWHLTLTKSHKICKRRIHSPFACLGFGPPPQELWTLGVEGKTAPERWVKFIWIYPPAPKWEWKFWIWSWLKTSPINIQKGNILFCYSKYLGIPCMHFTSSCCWWCLESRSRC